VTGRCDPDWITANRDQLFAEGAYLYSLHGVMFEEAERLARDVHGDFATTDPWDDILRDWAASNAGPILISDALRHGLGIPTAQLNKGAEMRAGASLQRLGYKRVQRRIEGSRRWVYVKAP
jgi:hypothetical protein